mgnify:FL=1
MTADPLTVDPLTVDPLTIGLAPEPLLLEELGPVIEATPLAVARSGAEEAPFPASILDDGSAPPCPELGPDLLGSIGLYSPALWGSLLIPFTAPAANAPNMTAALIALATASERFRGIKAG